MQPTVTASRFRPRRPCAGKRGRLVKLLVHQPPSLAPAPRLTTMPSQSHDASPATADTLAAALGRVPSGLFIVSWRAGEQDRPMLASWVMQAGFAPPLISVAVAAGRELLAALRDGQPFAVSVLAESQRGLLARFGKPPVDGDDPFAGLAIERTPAGLARMPPGRRGDRRGCRPRRGARPHRGRRGPDQPASRCSYPSQRAQVLSHHR
jgi:hypothetical protein